MEIGYLWLTLSLFLFLMTTGAAIILTAVAFPLVRHADEAHFLDAFCTFRRRQMWSYGLLAVLSAAGLFLLFLNPMYSLPEGAMLWMANVVGLLAASTVVSWFISRKLVLDGYRSGWSKWLGVFQWTTAITWLGGSCVLVWAFVEAVGLV